MFKGLGDRLADAVAKFVGSWTFIIIQSVGLSAWILLNVLAPIHHWDGYPFILLNLVLSFQAAFTAPVIMISQNRQEAIQRRQDLYLLHLMEGMQAQIKLIIDDDDSNCP